MSPILKKTRLAAIMIAGGMLSACAAQQPIRSTLPATPVPVQILALNDFHGNLEVPQGEYAFLEDGTQRSVRLGGAARLAALLESVRKANTVTVAAGDLIGASPLISSLFLDEPTVRVLSTLGLDVASVGNHEFDRGVAELRRMQDGGCDKHTMREPCAIEPFAGAGFNYLAGNTVDEAGNTLFPATQMREIAGAQIGFIGLTLENTKNLVSAQATQGYTFLDEAQTANTLAAQLQSAGADAVVLLIHEGAVVDPRFNIAGCPGLSGAVVPIVEALDPSISVVVSGHTHQSYVCNVPTNSGEDVLLTSGGRYGAFVTDITMMVDPAAGIVTSVSARNIPVDSSAGTNAAVEQIVATYAEASGPVANRPVGPIVDTGEIGDDCGDRPAQQLVADSYLDAANSALSEPADLALVNSGSVRTYLTGADDGVLTFGELSAMAPFGNSLIVLEMTGAQIMAVLEQQLCGDGPAVVCDSTLIPSTGTVYTLDVDKMAGKRVTGMQINGAPLDPARSYRLVTNNFLVGGGDGFAQFTTVPQIANVGFDIDALEAYVAAGDVIIPVCGRVQGVLAAD